MDRIVTVGVAARIAGCSARTVRRWADIGVLPAHIAFRPYAGAHLRIRLDAFRAWVGTSGDDAAEKADKADKADTR